MVPRCLGLVLLVCLPLAASAQCDATAKLAEYRSTPPLLAGQGDVSYRVTVYADGCVSAHFPKQDLRHGTRVLKLAAAELDLTLEEIDASGVAAIDGPALRVRLKDLARQKSAKPDAPLYRISDENILEFEFTADKSGRAPFLAWRSLRDDLLNHPDQPELARIAALQQVFVELGERAVTRSEIMP
ncbi:MAG TPA: hypothetical protein VFG21_08725 [Xanthomonadaceae bacterium]|nr:hypothetical protein [Xanthomonadaceae bacterium]